MATYYSDHYSSDGISRTTRDSTKFADTGLGSSKVFSVLAYAKALALTTDVVRMFALPSGCRVIELMASADDAAAAGAFHVGLYKTEALGGAVIDADLFSSALAKDAARVDALIESTSITKMLRGKYLWEMAAVTVATITKNPNEKWDVCITPSTSFTTTANGFLLEAKILLGS